MYLEISRNICYKYQRKQCNNSKNFYISNNSKTSAFKFHFKHIYKQQKAFSCPSAEQEELQHEKKKKE